MGTVSQVLVVLVVWVNFVHGQINSLPGSNQTQFFLDRYSDCDGKPREIYRSTVSIYSTSAEKPGQPVTSCTITLSTESGREPYRFKLQIMQVDIKTPDVHLYIYDGDYNGRLLLSVSKLSDSSQQKDLNFIFTTGQLVTFRMTRAEVNSQANIAIVVTPVPVSPSLPPSPDKSAYLCHSLLGSSQTQFFLDRYSDCDGKPREIYRSTVSIYSTSAEKPGQPVTSCTITLSTESGREPYRFKLQIMQVDIKTPDVNLYIYDGEYNGRLLLSFSKLNNSSQQKDLNFIFTTGQLVTFRMTRAEVNSQANIGIVVTPVPADTDVASDYIETTKFPVGAIIVNMDSPTACGKTFYAGDREIFTVKPRGSVGVSNPPTSCVVYFEPCHASSNYKFEIVVEASAFRDCGLNLRIFDGKSTGSNYIRMLGCGSTTSTGHFYSKDRAMTLMLTRTQNQYFFGSDFQLKIQLYSTDNSNSNDACNLFRSKNMVIVSILVTQMFISIVTINRFS